MKRHCSALTVSDDFPVLKCDNVGAVELANNPEFYKRSKHIDTRYFWIRERYLSGDFSLEHIARDGKIADIHSD